MMHKFLKPQFEVVSPDKHKEYQVRNTRVSEYLRKYGQGKIDSLPTDSRPVVIDPRSDDDKLSNNDKLDHMSNDELDVLTMYQDKLSDFEAAISEIKLTQKQKEQFDAAAKVLNDKNASYEQKADAYRILQELEEQHKVTRAR